MSNTASEPRVMTFAAQEAYKTLRTNLEYTLTDSSCRVIGITSANRMEGKSFTAVNLARSIAETGKSTLLIDADMRLPSIYKKMNLNKAPGLSELLAGIISGGEAIQTTDQRRLNVMAAGAIPPNPAELLGSKRFATMIETLKNSYKYIIIDLPPITIVSDALVVSPVVDGMVVVVRKDYTRKPMLDDCISQFQFQKVKLMGIVVNEYFGDKKSSRSNKKNITDYHTHVLPGIDDGSKNVSMSLAMLNILKEQGVTSVACTPHYYPTREDPASFLKRREASYNSICEELSDELPSLLLGAEFYYYEGISRLDCIDRFIIHGTDLLLLEMPFTKWASRWIDELIELNELKNIHVMLAHVNRYRKYLDWNTLRDIAAEGIAFQINNESFNSFPSRRKTMKLFKIASDIYLGSDAHNADSRRPNWNMVPYTMKAY